MAELTYVTFFVMNKDNLPIKKFIAESCFYDIMCYPIPEGTDHILFYPETRGCRSEEEVKQWISDVNSWGFPMEYLGVSEDKIWGQAGSNSYIIKIPLFDSEGKQLYKTKLHFGSALILSRYIYEEGIKSIIEHYFALKKLFPEEDTFNLMQIAHVFYWGQYYNSNHTLMEHDAFKVIKRSDMLTRLKKSRDLSEYGRDSITATWVKERDLVKGFDYENLIRNKEYEKVYNYITKTK